MGKVWTDQWNSTWEALSEGRKCARHPHSKEARALGEGRRWVEERLATLEQMLVEAPTESK